MGLSEVSLLYAKRVGDLERAREVFTDDCRAFVDAVLKSVQRVKNWSQGRVRIDLEKEISESKAGYVSSQYTTGSGELRFKRENTSYTTPVADLEFGLRYDKEEDCFVWQVTLLRGGKFRRLDHLLWHRFKDVTPMPPGARHFERDNVIRFVMRHVDQVTPDTAYADVKAAFGFLLGCEAAIADAAGEARAADATSDPNKGASDGSAVSSTS